MRYWFYFNMISGACEGSLACSTCHVIVMVCVLLSGYVLNENVLLDIDFLFFLEMIELEYV